MSRLISEALSQETFSEPKPTAAEHNHAELALSVESAALELTELTHEIEIENYRLEELEHVAVTLESIQDSIRRKLEEDERGLDRYSAEGYQQAVRAVLGDFANPMGSLESYGGQSEAYRATELSIESIGEWFSQIWQAIKNAVNKIWESVSKFFARLIDGVERMSQRQEALNSKVSDMKSGNYAAGSEHFEAPYADNLAIDGEVTPTKVVNSAEQVDNKMVVFLSEASEGTKEYFKALYDFYRSKPEDDSDLRKAQNDHYEKVTRNTRDISGLTLPGDRELVIETEEIEGDKRISGMKIEQVSGAGSPNASSPVPSLDEIERMLELAGNHIANLKSFSAVHDEIIEASKGAAKEAEESFQEHLKEQEDGEGNVAGFWNRQKVNYALRQVRGEHLQMLTSMYNWYYQYIRSLLSYVDAATKEYSEQTEESLEGDDEGKEKESDDSSKLESVQDSVRRKLEGESGDEDSKEKKDDKDKE